MKVFNCLSCGKEHQFKGYSYTNKYCDNKCQSDFQYKQYIEEWKQGLQEGRCGKLQTSRHIKRYFLENQEGKCAECGIVNHNGLPITLELDHKDGDASNNVESNLRCLCPNCHSQTLTYRAKNRGNGRKERKK